MRPSLLRLSRCGDIGAGRLFGAVVAYAQGRRRDPMARVRASGDVKKLAARHMRLLDDKIRDLQAMRDTLAQLAHHCHGDERPVPDPSKSWRLTPPRNTGTARRRRHAIRARFEGNFFIWPLPKEVHSAPLSVSPNRGRRRHVRRHPIGLTPRFESLSALDSAA